MVRRDGKFEIRMPRKDLATREPGRAAV